MCFYSLGHPVMVQQGYFKVYNIRVYISVLLFQFSTNIIYGFNNILRGITLFSCPKLEAISWVWTFGLHLSSFQILSTVKNTSASNEAGATQPKPSIWLFCFCFDVHIFPAGQQLASALTAIVSQLALLASLLLWRPYFPCWPAVFYLLASRIEQG